MKENRVLMQYFEWYLKPEDKLWQQVSREAQNLKEIGINYLFGENGKFVELFEKLGYSEVTISKLTILAFKCLLIFLNCFNLDYVYAKENSTNSDEIISQIINGINEEDLKKTIESDVFALNKKLPSYSQITLCEIRNAPFEKTPKLSIKRFMYK